jgi:hypothetical protein
MESLARLNATPAVWGIASIISAFGSRYVVTSITPAQEAFLKGAVMRRIVIACMVFVITRNIMVSVMVTFGVVMVLEMFANEQSSLCLFFPKPTKLLGMGLGMTVGAQPQSPQSPPPPPPPPHPQSESMAAAAAAAAASIPPRQPFSTYAP